MRMMMGKRRGACEDKGVIAMRYHLISRRASRRRAVVVVDAGKHDMRSDVDGRSETKQRRLADATIAVASCGRRDDDAERRREGGEGGGRDGDGDDEEQ